MFFLIQKKMGQPLKNASSTFEVRRKRAKELRELGQKIYLSELKKQTFYEHSVLVENNYGIGKTENNFM